jgi:hypothetical protein
VLPVAGAVMLTYGPNSAEGHLCRRAGTIRAANTFPRSDLALAPLDRSEFFLR